MINQENHRKEGHEDVYLEKCSMNIQQSIWTEFVRYSDHDRVSGEKIRAPGER